MYSAMKRGSAVITLASLVVLCAPTTANAISCGEALTNEGDTCTDWQCSRNVSNFCVRGIPLDAECQFDSDCYYEMHCAFANQTTTDPVSGANSTALVGACTKNGDSGKNIGIGLVGAFVGVICFGSSFVPIKRYKKYAGDGVFAQFCMCFGRFMVGVCFLAAGQNLTFYWAAAGGGALWTLGNVLSVPIIQCIGIGLGVSIWGTTNMLLGWASGHFGLMGVKPEATQYPALEYCSVVASFAGIILFIFVKPSSRVQKNDVEDDYASPQIESGGESFNDRNDADDAREGENTLQAEKRLANNDDDENGLLLEKDDGSAPPKRQTLADTLGPKRARIIGISMALTAGCLYGICMNPAQHLMTHYDTLTAESDYYKFSPKGLDYVFSNNVGAMCMSFVVLVVYLILQKFNLTPSEKYFEPVVHSKLLLPAFAAGAIGSMGSAAWFFANQNLGLVVSFPIVAAGPGVVSSLWGALVFKEVHGIKNFAILGGAFIMVIAAAVMSSVAKGDTH